jgi:DNA-directed RNA polymerase
MQEMVKKFGRGAELAPAQKLLLDWFTPLKEAIEEEKEMVKAKKSGIDRSIYGPHLLLLESDTLAVITMHEFVNLALVEPRGIKVVRVATAIGRAVENEVRMKWLAETVDDKWKKITKEDAPAYEKNRRARQAQRDAEEDMGWDSKIVVKVGASLLVKLMETAKVRLPREEVDGKMIGGESVDAFIHGYIFQYPRRYGVLRCHEQVYKSIMEGNLVRAAPNPRYLPMVVEPQPWASHNEGGYLKLSSMIMRTRGSNGQIAALKKCEMPQVMEGLNSLSQVRWQINSPILDVIQKLWEDGGAICGLPPRADFEFPDEPMEDEIEEGGDFEAASMSHNKLVSKLKKANRDLHSLRCDVKLKLQVAQEFRQYEKIYFPYNIDFRGRAYPIPPNLNHLGNDICRGLLMFADKKPLGEDGLQWMKIHLANLFGKDKMSFAMRIQYMDGMLDQVRDSAYKPLNGDQWWMQADEPFQALATCIELAHAIDSPNPAEYKSSLPVHMDGSCNGLQHYAALGRDDEGGRQVNLTPSEEPQDVYTGVADMVINQIARDAAMVEGTDFHPDDEDYAEVLEKRRYAQMLEGQITRKVVKQTVMTSVYGVTFVGARKQIQARLQENMVEMGAEDSEEIEQELYGASCYVARMTMDSMGTLFSGARGIMVRTICSERTSPLFG